MRAIVPLAFSAVLFAGPAATASPAGAGDRLQSGEVSPRGANLVAGDHGATYELRGGSIVKLSAGAEFTFDPSVRLKLGKAGDPDTITRAIRVFRGRADVAIPEVVRTPTAVLLRSASKLSGVTKEGQATFLVDGDRTTVAARKGEMLVGLGNDWKPMREGHARTLSPEDPVATPRAILGAPVPSTGRPIVLLPTGSTTSLGAHWTAVPGATHYVASLLDGSGGGSPAADPLTTREPTAAFASVPVGAYGVEVVALDRFGLPGAPSKLYPVRIVGMEVPEGAWSTADGAIVLGRDQRVRLQASAGLELTYGGSTLFIPAPDALSLARNAPTTARLRIAGDPREAVVRLEPKGLRAEVRISPRAARWPTDQVVVEVEVVSSSGRPVPDEAKIDATVTVNLAPTPVKWTKSGQVLRAVLPPGNAPGPWVVRAEVKDGTGEMLGRDFLEIAPAGQGSARAAAVAIR